MSNESAFTNPASAASFAAPTTPAAGPDSSANAAWAAASSKVARPPDERMTSGVGRPAPRAGFGEPAQVAREHRAEVGIDRRRRRALVLAELRRHFVGRDDVSIRIAAAQLARHRLLRGVVPKGEEQRDGDRLGIDIRQRAEVERDELALRAGSTTDPDAPVERYERRRMLGARPIEVRAGLPTEMKDVFEALVRDESGARAAAFEERIGRDRGAVSEAADRGRPDGESSGDDRVLLALGRGHLRDPDLAVGDEHCVREGPADVDPERTHGVILGHGAE